MFSHQIAEGTLIRQGKAGHGLFHTADFLNKLQIHKPMLDVSLEEVTGPEINETVALMNTLRNNQS